MRRVAVVLAVFVAVAQLGLFLLTERGLGSTLALVGGVTVGAGLRWVWALGWALPWVVGAVLLLRGRERIGSAVLLTAAAMAVADGIGALTPAIDLARLGRLPGGAALVERVGGALVWLAALAAGIVAWRARPRGGWREAAPGPVGWYVTLAVFAWLPSLLRTTAFAPVGAPRRFAETDVSRLTGLEAAGSIAGAVVALVVLFVAPRLRRDIAGAVLLAYAAPTLLANLGAVVVVVTEDDMILTPAGVLGLIGLAGLVAAGAVWSARRADAPGAAGAPG